MTIRWIPWMIAALAVAPLAQGVDVGQPGFVLMRFSGAGGPPAVTAAPTLDCTAPAFTAGAWSVDCAPQLPPGAAVPAFQCKSPVGIAGGTPVTIGTASVRVGCGGSAATCAVSWTVQGQCVALLSGTYRFPLRCAGTAQGTIVGAGAFYVECLLSS
jgi:hypothetical protein